MLLAFLITKITEAKKKQIKTTELSMLNYHFRSINVQYILHKIINSLEKQYLTQYCLKE